MFANSRFRSFRVLGIGEERETAWAKSRSPTPNSMTPDRRLRLRVFSGGYWATADSVVVARLRNRALHQLAGIVSLNERQYAGGDSAQLSAVWGMRVVVDAGQTSKPWQLLNLHIVCAVKRHWTSAGATPARELVRSTR
jgi:hypothetical protein